MAGQALTAVERAIAALTYDEIEVHEVSRLGALSVTLNGDVPLLDRSIARDLEMFAKQPESARKKLLMANAAAIDEALLAIEEARLVLQGGMA